MEDGEPQKYKIGVAEKVTGIPAMTIRMWERRYNAVEPERTPGNGRLYSRAQLSRLSMLRQLVESGHAISTIAGLSDAELGERVSGLEGFRPQRSGPVALGVVGASLALQAREDVASAKGDDAAQKVVLAGAYDDDEAALAGEVGVVDALVVERAIVNPETVRELQALTAHFSATVTVVVYQFAPSAQLAVLHRAGFHTVSAPVRVDSLVRMLPALVGVSPDVDSEDDDEAPDVWMRQPPPARRYSQWELHRWAKRSSSVQCECPEHLVALISRLVAFEDYSRDCESRNPADASIHLMLHHTSANARRALEDALAHLIAHEFPDESA